MSKVKDLERTVKALAPKELAAFRRWFAAYDAKAWDSQFERDARAGKLDRLADAALREHAAGRTTGL